MRALLLVPLLAALWVGLAESLTLLHLVVGLILGLMVVLLMVRYGSPPVSLFLRQSITPAWGLRLSNYVGHLLWEVLKANLRVAIIVLEPGRPIRPGIVAFPTETQGDLQNTVLANSITVTPGTITVEFSHDRRHLYVHTLDIETPEQVKQGIRQGLERYIIEAL